MDDPKNKNELQPTLPPDRQNNCFIPVKDVRLNILISSLTKILLCI